MKRLPNEVMEKWSLGSSTYPMGRGRYPSKRLDVFMRQPCTLFWLGCTRRKAYHKYAVDIIAASSTNWNPGEAHLTQSHTEHLQVLVLILQGAGPPQQGWNHHPAVSQGSVQTVSPSTPHEGPTQQKAVRLLKRCPGLLAGVTKERTVGSQLDKE